MDYAHRQRMKILGHMRIIDAADDPVLATTVPTTPLARNFSC
jgi:hypothetical protein